MIRIAIIAGRSLWLPFVMILSTIMPEICGLTMEMALVSVTRNIASINFMRYFFKKEKNHCIAVISLSPPV
jgi:hypothetical protein